MFITPEGSVRCQYCECVWYPSFVIAGYVAEKADLVATITSAMLWDFHERAVVKYGEQVAEALTKQDESMYERSPEDCHSHNYNNGECVHCGASAFLGDA